MKRILLLLGILLTCGFIWPLHLTTPTSTSTPINPEPYGTNSWVNRQMQIIEGETKINPAALRTGLEAYTKARADGLDNKQILTIVDFTQPSTAKRLWVFDLRDDRVLFNTWVSHGKNSGGLNATSFSNNNSSLKSSIGVFVTDSPYVGHDGYSLRVSGLEPGINDHALSRAIVFHGARYVNASMINQYGEMGRSWGCFAVTENLIAPIVNDIKNNTVVVAYYPDRYWLSHSQFLS